MLFLISSIAFTITFSILVHRISCINTYRQLGQDRGEEQRRRRCHLYREPDCRYLKLLFDTHCRPNSTSVSDIPRSDRLRHLISHPNSTPNLPLFRNPPSHNHQPPHRHTHTMSSPQLPYPGFRPNFDTCTEVTPYCPVEITTYGDYFNLGACIFFTVFHALLLISQLGIGIRYRTWTFTVFLAIGTGFELMGYGARISMTPIGTVWSYPAFVIQLLMLILGPTLVAAAISVTFKWIVIQCGERYSIMKPKWYP